MPVPNATGSDDGSHLARIIAVAGDLGVKTPLLVANLIVEGAKWRSCILQRSWLPRSLSRYFHDVVRLTRRVRIMQDICLSALPIQNLRHDASASEAQQ